MLIDGRSIGRKKRSVGKVVEILEGMKASNIKIVIHIE